ncbi:hypothetical protein EfmJHP9_07220 [Enterococcus faecium]|nr:hypothetical protein EfmJHP9_07220 [Enterococcus faecium]
MLAQQVEIKTREGKIVHGVIGSKPPHVLTPQVRNKPYEITNELSIVNDYIFNSYSSRRLGSPNFWFDSLYY